jgi:hypothetical protein
LRAYVYLEGFKYELTLIDDSESGRNTELQGHLDRGLFTTRFAAQPIWKNSGATPTINLRIKIWSRIPGVFNRQVGEYEKADSGTPFFLGPQAVAGSGFIEFGGALNGAIQNGMPLQEPPPFLIWGRADYEDVFGGAHFTEWCYRVRPSRPTRDERLSVGFVQWAEYNQTDK